MNLDRLTAADVMSRVLVTVGPEESPLIAWEIMRRGGVHHLPVIDDRLRLHGVLTREQVAAHWSGGPAVQSAGQVRDLLAAGRARTCRPPPPCRRSPPPWWTTASTCCP